MARFFTKSADAKQSCNVKLLDKKLLLFLQQSRYNNDKTCNFYLYFVIYSIDMVTCIGSLRIILFVQSVSSVVDPNTLNFDPDPGFWPNLDPDPDPGNYYQF